MNINKLIEKGEEAHKKRNYDYAISIFLEAVNFQPDSRRAREGLRNAALKKHENNYPGAGAVAIFGMGAKLGMFFAGLGKKSNPEPYMMACERFLRLDPKNKKVNMKLGEAAEMAGHLNAAILAYEVAAEYNPGDVSALKKLGNLLWKNGEIDKAHATFDRVVKLAPQDQEAVKARKNLAAEASLKQTGFETAKSSRDLVRDKDQQGKLEQEARLFQTDDDLSKQKAGIEAKLADDANNIDLLQDLAEICEKQRDWDGALAAFDRAIAAQPENVSLQFGKGDVEINRLENDIYQLERENEAAAAGTKRQELLRVQTDQFRARVRAYPTDLNLRYKLGKLLLEQGQVEEAIGQFQQTIKDPKYRGESQLQLGLAFAKKGQNDLAIRQLDQALEGTAGMTDRRKAILYALGDVHEAKGAADKAKDCFAQIYEAEIGYRDVADRLAKLESAPNPDTLSLD